MAPSTKSEITGHLQSVRDSCYEGIDGSWEVNAEGFEAMAEAIEKVASLLGITLAEYQPDEDEAMSDFL